MGPKAKGGSGGCGRKQHVDTGKGPLEIAANQGAHLLGLFVVSIHITGRKGIGADQDPALHLIAKAFGAATGGHFRQSLGACGAIAIFDPVVARQVGGRL